MDEKIHFLFTLQHYEHRSLEMMRQNPETEFSHCQETIHSTQKAFEQAHQNLLRRKCEISTSEQNLQETKENIRQALSQQALAKKIEAFQALSTKISQLQKKSSELEEEILLKLEILETEEKRFSEFKAETQSHLKKLQKELNGYQNDCLEHKNNLTSIQDKIKTFREDIVDNDLLRLYDQTKMRNVRFPWLTTIKGHCCQGCHIHLSPEQDSSSEQNPYKLLTCEHCGRLLFKERIEEATDEVLT